MIGVGVGGDIMIGPAACQVGFDLSAVSNVSCVVTPVVIEIAKISVEPVRSLMKASDLPLGDHAG